MTARLLPPSTGPLRIVASRGLPHYRYFRTTGRIHAVESIIIRWNHRGTYAHPWVSVLSVCGRQEDPATVSAYTDAEHARPAQFTWGACLLCARRLAKRLDNRA